MSKLLALRKRIQAVRKISSIARSLKTMATIYKGKALVSLARQKQYLSYATDILQRIVGKTCLSTNSQKVLICFGIQKGLSGALAHNFQRELEHLVTITKINKVYISGKNSLARFTKSLVQLPYEYLASCQSDDLDVLAQDLANKGYQINVLYPMSIGLGHKFEIFELQNYEPLSDYCRVYKTVSLIHCTAVLNYASIASQVAEQTARLVSMEGALQSSERFLYETQLLYNNIRKDIITNELNDINIGRSVNHDSN